MRRVTINFLVDFATLAVMLFMVLTGLILAFVLLPGAGRSGGAIELWGLTRHEWGDVHFWTAVSLSGLLVAHLALHWSWVCGMVRRLTTGTAAGDKTAHRRTDWAYGLGFAAAVALMMGSFVWVAREAAAPEPAHRAARAGLALAGAGGRGGSAQATVALRGSMTVAEAAQALHLPVEEIQRRLSLRGAPADERLGRAVREAGLTFSEARRLLGAEGDACAGQEESTD